MAKLSELKEKYGPWALVTGASSGIGEQFARLLARARFNLLIVARRRERLEALAAELRRGRRGLEVEPVVADLADPDAVDRVTAGVGERNPGLVVSNAGFGLKGRFVDADRSQLEAMFNVNARTPLLIAHALLPRLLMRPHAGVIFTGSVEGEVPYPWSAAYAATKAFVHSLGMSLYGECAGTGVDVLVLAPGATDTEAITLQGFRREVMPGLMAPADVAKEALRQLGRVPLFIPGAGNRKFVSQMRRMPREKLIAANAQAMAAALEASGRPLPPEAGGRGTGGR